MSKRLILGILIAVMPQIALAAEESSGGMLGMDRPAPGARPPAPPPQYRPQPAQPPAYRAPPPVYSQGPPPYAGPPPVYRPYYPPPPVYGGPPPIYRPGPPGWAYGPPPRPGFTCSTRRFECDLYRPRPLGSYCECRTPWGESRPGRVTP